MANRKPNIVILLIDDMGWKDAGFMGSAYYETPYMDRLASQGMTFSNAYANPNCAPSRASLMTGLYTPRHGIYSVGSAERGQAEGRKLTPPPNMTVLDSRFTTLAEGLKLAGYSCAHVGKWHLGEGAVSGPEGRGFDLNVGGIQKGQPPAGYFSPYQIATLKDGPDQEYLTDRLTEEALSYIEKHADEPFFLYFAHYAVHKPLQAKQELIDKYEQKPADLDNGHHNPIYAAMLDSTDQSVGRIVGKLKELGIAEETVIMLLSDNGGLGGYAAEGLSSQEVTSQLPLRGGKGMLYEGGIRVPMIVSWPDVIRAGAASDIPISVIDFFPTLMELAGVSEESYGLVDGESLLPVLKEIGGLTRETLFWHFPAYLEGGNGKWRTTPGAALRHKEWKLIEFFEDDRIELYNLETDIGERHNLVYEMPEKVEELHLLMLGWRDAVEAPMPSEKG